jgi:hypothetical protein
MGVSIGAATGGARVTVTVTETGALPSAAAAGVDVVRVTGGVLDAFMGSGFLG